jgi:hypothetical protein
MRAVLCTSLSGLALMLALLTALVQNENRARGLELDALKEKCSMLEAVQGDRLEQILERDWGPLPFTPRPPKNAPPKLAPHAHAAGRADS